MYGGSSLPVPIVIGLILVVLIVGAILAYRSRRK